MTERFYVTTPIYYVNSSPHVGTAYTTIVADALTRYYALRGRETWFLTGTDEHGLKLEREARKREMSPQHFVDESSAKFRELWPKLLCRPDDFLRTTEGRHEERVQRYWRACLANGDIYLGSHKGLYCVACEEFKTEKDLLPGNLCAIHERAVETVEEPSYFFRLSAYEPRLLAFFDTHPDAIRPEGRRNEVLAFIRQGLKDLSISRASFTWGIPVPDDPKHVVYVWFDALFNYLTALEDGPRRERFWPPDAQLVGKDILRFHTVFWHAFLMSAGFSDDQLPRTVFSHGWLTTGGRKVSKTKVEGAAPTELALTPGTTDPVRLAEVLGPDVLRYYLLREVAFGQDGEFWIPSIIARARAELAETVGNLLNRVLPFTKHFDNRVPLVDPTAVGDAERALRARAESTAREVGDAWNDYQMHRGLELTIELARAGNKLFEDAKPWLLVKSGELAKLASVVYAELELLRIVSLMLWPVTPSKSDAIRAQLGLDPVATHHDIDGWPLAWGGLAAHTLVAPAGPVFPKYDPIMEAAMLRDLDVKSVLPEETPKPAAAPKASAPKAPPAAPAEPPAAITYDDFAKVDLRVGKVLTAERIPRKDKLLKLSVDLGEPSGPRTIIAGIAMSFTPEALVGTQVVVVANLAPRDFGGGLVSHGMLLAAGASEDLCLATFTRDRAPGTRVK